MPTDFKFPDVGEGITEGEIVGWAVREGDLVQEHQPIVKIETDKAVVEIPSPKNGRVLRIYHKEGDTVKVGEILVTLGEPGEKLQKPQAVEVQPKVSVVGVLEEAPETVAGPSKTLAAPATRRLARELGVDISQLRGTGLDGRITEEDVRRSVEAKGRKPEVTKIARRYDLYGYIEALPMRGVRKSTAKRMVESSRTVVHVTHMDEADVTDLVKIKEKERGVSEKQGIHLTYVPFVMKATVAALKEYPYLNSSVDDEHEEIMLKKYYNIGVAVDTDDGLIVPVVKGADQKSILAIAHEIQELSEKARSRTVDLADLKGGTFTITNIGFIGGLHATPIINYPETSILATGRIHEKAVVREGKIAIRNVMPLSLSFDHRVIDGAMAARFVNVVIKHLEDPDLLLLEGE